MPTLGDVLAQRIQRYVASQVPPDQVEIVTRCTCQALVTMMSDPAFVENLYVVRELRQENQYLRTQLAIVQTTLARMRPATKPTAKKAPRKRQPTKAQAKAFQQGVRDLRR